MKNIFGIELSAIIVGILLSIPYGIGSWLKWQSMKKETIIPVGSVTAKYGNIVGFFIKVVCISLVFYWFDWMGILLLAIMWFLGNWIATLLERKLYCNEWQMNFIVLAAQQYARHFGQEIAVSNLEKFVPKWWIKLMPMKWQKQLIERLVTILQPEEEE